MSLTVYLSCARQPERSTAWRWLGKAGFTPIQGVAAPPAACDPTAPAWAETLVTVLAATDVLVLFSRLRGTGLAGRTADMELGAAVALGRRVVVVGRSDHPMAMLPGVERCRDWEEAKAVLSRIAGKSKSEPQLSVEDTNYALKFWGEFAVKIIGMSDYLDKYAPGVAARVNDYTRCRSEIYTAIVRAWVAAGRPCCVTDAKEPLSPEAARYAEHVAVAEWFGGCVRVAEIDSTQDDLARRREAALASMQKPHEPTPG
jgi:hypothetical protein